MATELKLRRGTTSQHSSFTGAESEVTVDTDKNTVVVHDGATAGGFPLLRENASSGLPTIKPSLNLDFANTKSLDPRIDFTRASTATYYDGVTHAKAEENLLLYSQEFDNSAWAKDQASVTANAATAPDGTSTADKVQQVAGDTVAGRCKQLATSVSGNSYAISVFAKAGTNRNFLIIQDSLYQTAGSEVWFDILNGTVGTVERPASHTANIVSVGNGWYRCTVEFTANVSNSGIVGFSVAESDNSFNVTDDEGFVYLWGAQLEQRDTPTAYTPTTDAPITNYIPVLKTASTNEPRFDHDPITGESLGLLVEEQRTNLFTYSEDFSDASWATDNGIKQADVIIAPDGSLTGGKAIADATDNLHRVQYNFGAATEGDVYTGTVYLKAGEYTTANLRVGRSPTKEVIDVDLTDGSISNETSNVLSSSAEDVGNGWYRVSITVSINQTNPNQYLVIAPNLGDTTVYTGDGFSGVYIWGAQLEEASFPTSYIKTEGSQVTRVADSASITGDNFSEWYRQDEGTVFGEFKVISEINDGSFDRVFDINDGTGDNTFRIYRVNNAFDFNSRVNGQTNFFTRSNSDFAVDDFGSFAFAVSSDSISVYADGNELKTETDSNNLSTTVDRLNIGADDTLSRQPNAHIKRLTYYPKRLPNTVLQALTEE